MPKSARPERRTRGEIDRNYLFGDVFIKTGVAGGVAAGMIAAYTSGTLIDKVREGEWAYLAVMGAFVATSLAAFMLGRHLRKTATHWDFD
ncbi:MAG: hypothetical protein NW203_08345 [Hyphomonadaceae bacterium]|nr:hypothetical protein [Hyphomonadaceae bacterium]